MPDQRLLVGFGEFPDELSSLDFTLHVLYGFAGGIALGLLGFICFLFHKRPTRSLLTWIFFLVSVLALIIFLTLCVITILLRAQQLKKDVLASCSEHAQYLGGEESFMDGNLVYAIFGLSTYPANFDMWVPLCRSILQAVLVMISDGAICYRAGALTPRKSIRIVLGILTTVCLGSGTFIIYLYIREAVLMWSGGGYTFRTVEIKLSYFFFGWSVLCNLTATGIFGSTL